MTVNARLQQELEAELARLREAGTYKRSNTLLSPQGPRVNMEGRGDVVQEPRIVDEHGRESAGADFKASSRPSWRSGRAYHD